MKSVDKLSARVTDTIDRYPALGLQGWELHISIVDEVADSGVASCSTSKHYNSMWLEFEKKWLRQATDDDIDKVIIHELLHAVFRDLDRVVEDMLDYLGEPHRSGAVASHTHELEGVIERLARTLHYASKQDVVQ